MTTKTNTSLADYRKAVKLLGQIVELEGLNVRDSCAVEELLDRVSENYLLKVCEQKYADNDGD